MRGAPGDGSPYRDPMNVLSVQNVSSADAVGLSAAHNLLSAHVFPETVQVDLSNRREEQRLRHL